MTIEDQVAAMFARANPVPSLDLLDPIEPVDFAYLEDRSERSSTMTEVKTIEPKKEGRRIRWVPVTATILVAVAALAIVFSGRVFKVEPATPVEVADVYMEAVNDRDFEAAVALFSPGTDTSFIEQKVGFGWWAWRGATGEMHLNQGCREISEGDDGVLVECIFRAEDDLTRVLGLEPGSGQVRLLILDGQVQDVVTDTLISQGGIFEAGDTFNAWVQDNHPGDLDTMITLSGNPKFDPESIALWEQYTDEFVADMEDSG